MADPKDDTAPQAGAAADPQAGNTGAGAGKSPADEPISLEKAKELRAEAKNLRDRLKALEDEKAQRVADEKNAAELRAKEQGEWQKLAETRAGEIAALEPKAKQYEELATIVREGVLADISEWPAEVKALVDADAPVLELVATVKRVKPLAARLSTAGAPPAGNGRGPKPAGAPDPAKAAEGARALVAGKRVYSL